MFLFNCEIIFSSPAEIAGFILEYSKIHLFPYSMRSGTAALNLPIEDEVDSKKVFLRKKMILKLSEEKYEKHLKKQIGKEEKVLIESIQNNISKGYSQSYCKVIINQHLENKKGKVVPVKICGTNGLDLIGVCNE